MKDFLFTDLISFVGETPKKFTGYKKYVSTGAVNGNIIENDDIELVDYSSRPSRANLVACSGDILFAKMAETEKTLLLDDETEKNIYSTGFCAIRAKENIIEPKALYYLLGSSLFLSQKNTNSSGATQRAITNTGLSKIRIKLPTMEKQREFCGIMDRVVNSIELRKKQLKCFDELTKSLFIEMFGDIHNNKNYDYTNIEEITSVLSGGTPDRKENKYWEGGTINWVKTTELNNNIIIETEEKITNLGLENSSAKIIPPQSILIAMYGQGKTRGMTGYLEVSSATNQACACILPSRYINQKYLWNYLILSYDKLRSMAKGGNQPNLNVMIIKKFPVLIPPMNLQEKFVQSVSSIDKSKFASFSYLSA